MLAEVLEGVSELVVDFLENLAGNPDFARARQLFQARSDVHPLPVHVPSVLDDHIGKMDPDAHLNLLPTVPHRPDGKRFLNFDRIAHRLDRAHKLDDHAIPTRPYDPPVTLHSFRLDELAQKRVDSQDGALLVIAHEGA